VYVGSDDSKLYAINAANGLALWNFTTGGPVSTRPAVSKDQKTVYVGGFAFTKSELRAALNKG